MKAIEIRLDVFFSYFTYSRRCLPNWEALVKCWNKWFLNYSGSTSTDHARKHTRHRSITISELFCCSKNICVFCGKKIVLKTNLGITKHCIHTSYHKYSRLCMVSEEMRLHEIGYKYRYKDMCIFNFIFLSFLVSQTI